MTKIPFLSPKEIKKLKNLTEFQTES